MSAISPASKASPSPRSTWMLAGGGVVLLGGIALGTYLLVAPGSAPSAPPDIDQLREQMRRADLTDQQRGALREQMREAWQARMDTRLDEYFNASESDRSAILDRHIDEMQADWQDEQRRREQRRAEEAAASPQTQPAGQRPPRPNFAAMTQQERKARSESRNPDRQARMMAYFAAMRARAEARGIQIPMGPGRGPGGPGGPGGPQGGRRP